MSKFVELHDGDGHKRFINLDYVEEVWNNSEMCATVFFAFMENNGIEQDHFYTQESYEEVKRIILEATK